jgi:hypothetical protein
MNDSFYKFDKIRLKPHTNAAEIATGYGLDARGFGVLVSFSSPRRPHRLWGPPNLVSHGYRGLHSER